VEVKLTSPTYELYKRFFRSEVLGANVSDKKVVELWDATKSIFQNKKSGLLFFYEQPLGLNIQIIV
jgi:hypothetical protein